MAKLADIVVTNLHRRYTGVSATVAALVPPQQKREAVSVLDTGSLSLPGSLNFRDILRYGWTRPSRGSHRIWHARRDVEMLLGLFLKYVLRQKWKLVFTSAAPKRHGKTLRWIMNRMDAIIATSERAAGFLDWHSAIVPHGVDTDIFVPADRQAAKSALGFDDATVIGNFGRIRKSKGTDLFVEALLSCLPDFPNVIVVITGEAKTSEDEYLSNMRAKIADANLSERIQFWGDTDMKKVRQLYQACDLCVAASRTEGFGLTPLEAMASGSAVLTSGAGYWPELMKSGVAGTMFETGDAADLTKQLRLMLSDPDRLRRMGLDGRDYVVAHNSIASEVDRIFAVYDSLR